MPGKGNTKKRKYSAWGPETPKRRNLGQSNHAALPAEILSTILKYRLTDEFEHYSEQLRTAKHNKALERDFTITVLALASTCKSFLEETRRLMDVFLERNKKLEAEISKKGQEHASAAGSSNLVHRPKSHLCYASRAKNICYYPEMILDAGRMTMLLETLQTIIDDNHPASQLENEGIPTVLDKFGFIWTRGSLKMTNRDGKCPQAVW